MGNLCNNLGVCAQDNSMNAEKIIEENINFKNSVNKNKSNNINLYIQTINENPDNKINLLSSKNEENNNNIITEKKINEFQKIYDENMEKLNSEKQKLEQEQKNLKLKEEELKTKEKKLVEEQEKINKKEEELKITENQLIEKRKKLEEEIQKNEEVNTKNKIEFDKFKKEKEEYFAKLEEEWNNKIKNLENKKKKLKENEEEFNKKKCEFENKNKEWELKVKEKENQFKEEGKKLTEKRTLLESKNNQRESILETRESTIIEKEKSLKVKETKIIEKEKELELNYKQKENKIKEKEKLLNDEEQKLNEKKRKLKNKEEQIIAKENQLNKKLEKIELETKETKENLELQNQQLILREKKIKKKEEEIMMMNKPIIVGLNNIGATCYMNATLQCLSNSKKLTEYFLKVYKTASNKIMSNEYYEVLKNLWDRKNKAYSPYSFKEVLSKENPLFAGIAANDSKDLINFLLERFHQELNVIKPNINNDNMYNQQDQMNEQTMLQLFLKEFQEKFNSPISNLFYGILETKSQCQGCKIIKFNFQVYSFLEFPLQQVNQYFFNQGKRPLFTNDGKNPDVDLYECFEYNGKIDLMNGDNQMYCNICNKLYDSFYSTIIYSTPIYLVINLNRGKGATYECKVNFPDQLNLFNYVSFKSGYTCFGLYAVICHLGPSSMSGHFVAYCRNRTDNKWYLYNDGIVTLCTRPQEFNDGMPYILFYMALSLD